MKYKLAAIILSVMLVLLMLPATALAAEHPLANGESIDISTCSEGDIVRVATGASVTISGSRNNIAVICEAGVNVTLSGVTIDNTMNDFVCPLSFTGVDNTLTLAAGTVNSLTGGAQRSAVHAGGSTKLIIEGTGSLNATGGSAAAGIGGNLMGDCGTIEIKSGTISATVSGILPVYGGAGIGGGARGSGGNITISGGIVYARGGDDAAGIGGGGNGSGGAEAGSVTIRGGTVTAEGNGIADIGGAGGGTLSVDGGASVTLNRAGTNAVVTLGDCYILDKCTHPADYEPITDGFYIDGTLYTGTIIDVSSTSGGSGYEYSGEFFSVNESGTYLITGTTTKHEVAIWNAANIILFNVNITNNADDLSPLSVNNSIVDINLIGNNTLKSTSDNPGLNCGPAYIINIHGDGSLTATGGDNSAAIGGAQNAPCGDIAISGGTVTAIGGAQGSTGIGCGAAAPQTHVNAHVTITGGTVTATGYGGAGIGSGYGDPEGPVIEITGGIVNATGYDGGAGIGGGYGSSGGTIIISGGTVTAEAESMFGGAGIGSGRNGGGGNIQISGTANITATGSFGGAGIGGGDLGSVGTINISGGTINATGRGVGGMISHPGGAGIGGGTAAEGGSITISGGTVTATGTEYGAGVGSGYSGRNIDITITGGVLYASGAGIDIHDIGCETGESVNISGTAAVFAKRNMISAVTTATHTHTTYSEDTEESYGYDIPAAWTPEFGAYLRVYTLSYDLNNGSGTAPASLTQLHNTTAGVSDGSGLSHTGYDFIGWNTKAEGSGTNYSPGSTFTFADNMTLYANWTPNTYTVEYDANGGAGTMASGSHTYDVAKNLTTNGFTRTGYTFLGWAESSGGPVVYSDGQSASNLTATNGATVTLYARWAAHPELTSTDADAKIYVGGRVTLTPNIDGGEWDWDEEYLSATFNSPATFTGLKAGTTRVTYTVEGTSVYYDITIEATTLPRTGQDFTLVFALLGAGMLSTVTASIITIRRKKKSKA